MISPQGEGEPGSADGREAKVRPINWFDVLPPSLTFGPDSPEAGVMRRAELFEHDGGGDDGGARASLEWMLVGKMVTVEEARRKAEECRGRLDSLRGQLSEVRALHGLGRVVTTHRPTRVCASPAG